MNKHIKYTPLTLMLASIIGCAPLQQAPLVYTSTSTLGLGAAMNTTEGPGFDFTLGFKSVDSAYVPVAVAKEGETNKIDMIVARKMDKTTKLQKVNLSEEEQRKNYADTALQKARDDLSIYDDNKRKYDELKSKANLELMNIRQAISDSESALEEVESETVVKVEAVLELKSTISKKREEENQKVTEISNWNNLIPLDSERTTLLNAEKEAKAAYDLAVKAYDRVNRNGQASGDGSKEDAYSVYGSFDSNNNFLFGTDSQAKTGLGKVFSTGVAAQTLTEAAKQANTTACINSVIKLVETKPDITGDWSQLCTPLQPK